MSRNKCCKPRCRRLAEFEIRGEGNHPEDYTHACEKHVGWLLGTPVFLQRENRMWFVYYLGEESR